MGVLVLVGWSLTPSGRDESARTARLVAHSCNSSYINPFMAVEHTISLSVKLPKEGESV